MSKWNAVKGFLSWGKSKVSPTITKVNPVTHGSGKWSGVSKEVSKALISAHKAVGRVKRAEQKKWHQVHEAKQKLKKKD